MLWITTTIKSIHVFAMNTAVMLFCFRQMPKKIEIPTIYDLCWYTEYSVYGNVCYVNNLLKNY